VLIRIEINTAYSNNIASGADARVRKLVLQHQIGEYCFGTLPIRRSALSFIRRRSGSSLNDKLWFLINPPLLVWIASRSAHICYFAIFSTSFSPPFFYSSSIIPTATISTYRIS
jgi:hypothetical protein